jgi:hypothetical protein
MFVQLEGDTSSFAVASPRGAARERQHGKAPVMLTPHSNSPLLHIIPHAFCYMSTRCQSLDGRYMDQFLVDVLWHMSRVHHI